MLEKVPAPTMQGGMFSRLVKAGETCPIATTETYPDYLMPELPELTVEELARAESIASDIRPRLDESGRLLFWARPTPAQVAEDVPWIARDILDERQAS